MKARTRQTVPLVAALAVACGGDGLGAPRPDILPTRIHLTATASGTRSDGAVIDCGLDLQITLQEEIRRTATVVEYAGTMGGEARRSVLPDTGIGFSFWADVYWPTAGARLLLPDSLELVLGDTSANDGRFWHEDALLRGSRHPGDPGSGNWMCAPFDISQGGYVDTAGIAPGHWDIEPE
jgi:hypothetical protein